MIVTKIKYNGSKVRLYGFGPEKYQMFKLGQFALATVKARVAAGKGSDDAPMPPLKKRYAIQKSKAGAGNKRDLRLTGAMLDNFSVRSASATEVRLDITSRTGRQKARTNERRAPWFGFSTADTKAIYGMAQRMFKGMVVDFAAKVRGVRARPQWLDPLGLMSDAGDKAA